MSVPEIHVSDIGTKVRLHLFETDELTNAETPMDLAGNSTLEMIFKKPNAATAESAKTATVVGLDADGIIQYITESAFIDTIGLWEVQAHVIFSGGNDFKSKIGTFEVFANL